MSSGEERKILISSAVIMALFQAGVLQWYSTIWI